MTLLAPSSSQAVESERTCLPMHDKPRQHIKKQRHYFADKVPSSQRVKAMVFLVMYGCESWTIKKAAAAAKSRQSCPTLWDLIDGSPPGSRPWDSPGKNTGVGCHFLLQCMEVKSESEVAQSCPTLVDPMDCSLPVSSFHGISQARVLEWIAIAFSKES